MKFPSAPPKMKSTPQGCNGDGSYAMALDCYRMSSSLIFSVKDTDIDAFGTMSRPRPGAESVVIRVMGAGQWSAETKPSGVVWTHDGKRVTNEPAWADRIWQRTTMFLDPQMREGTPRLVGSDAASNHYHFTDANSGTPYDLYVSKRDGSVIRIRVGTFEMSVH